MELENKLAEAMDEADTIVNPYSYEHIFAVPFTYEGKTYETIRFNFGKLKGKDGLAIENELKFKGMFAPVPAVDGEYLARVAVRASEPAVGLDVLAAMPLSDYLSIAGRAKSFLLRSGS